MFDKEQSGHPLAGWWLIRSYPQGCLPFATIMTLSEADADAFCGTAGIGRGTSELGYYQDRLLVENWLATEAKAKSVRPETPHPLYFCLSPRPLQTRPGEGGGLTGLPIDAFDEHLVSLTIDDSFYNYFQATGQDRSDYAFRHELHGTVMSAREFRMLVGDYESVLAVPPDEPSLWNLGANPHGGPRYVEVQLWTHEIPVFGESR